MCVLANSAEKLARQNCASILLRRQSAQSTAVASRRDFKCKTCDRSFETFQALGGHRSSHYRSQVGSHECRGCGIRFPTRHALGGHMRKHVSLKGKRKRVEENDDDHDEISVILEEKKKIERIPISSKSKMSERVVLNFDLNLPPPMEECSIFCG